MHAPEVGDDASPCILPTSRCTTPKQWLQRLVACPCCSRTTCLLRSCFEGQRLQHLLQLRADFCGPMRLKAGEVAIEGLQDNCVPHPKRGIRRRLASVIEKVCSGRHTTCEVTPVKHAKCVSANALPGMCANNIHAPTCAARRETSAYFSVGVRGWRDRSSVYFCWSFKQMTEGRFPLTRHENKKWTQSDTWRRGKAGMSFLALADFNFPYWPSKQICWLCRVNCDEFDWRDVRWLSQRLTEKQFFKLRREQGIPSNPTFEFSRFKVVHVVIDALRAFDVGFSQDVVGHVVWEFMECVEIRTRKPSSCGRSCKNTSR